MMATYNGTSARDIYNGTSSADTAHGNEGDDTLNGLGGNDSLYGDRGYDGLYGGSGNDKLFGGIGVDALFGQDGSDQLYGDLDDDYIDGGAGNDYLNGGSGNDRLRGGDGDDTLNGSIGSNDLAGGNGNDTLIRYSRPDAGVSPGTAGYAGGAGNDTLLVDVQGVLFNTAGESLTYLQIKVRRDGNGEVSYVSSPDKVPGSYTVGPISGIETYKLDSADNLFNFSTHTNATVYGGSGSDRLEGMEGNQTFIGGAGADSYRFQWREGWDSGHDTVIGFNKVEGDRLAFDVGEDVDSVRISAAEQGGHTIYTSTEVATGLIVHTLEVDAVGLPPVEYYGIV